MQEKRRYIYSFQTIMRFDEPISHHYFKLRAIASENYFQKIISSKFSIKPKSNYSVGYDGWGNSLQYGSQIEPHDVFIFASSGEVELTPYKIEAESSEMVFLTHSALTETSHKMRDFLSRNIQNFDQNSSEIGDNIQNFDLNEIENCEALGDFSKIGKNLRHSLYLSNLIHRYMYYSSGVTTISTKASEAFSMGMGVCQDYSHILIALCRKVGIAARYVNGLMHGEGESHAWVEIYCSGYWWGVDPTNNRFIDYGYIKIAHGRDASDCHLNRGVFCGKTHQINTVRVVVEQI